MALSKEDINVCVVVFGPKDANVVISSSDEAEL
jgi:hypothetical protein